MGIFSVALASAALPAFSGMAAANWSRKIENLVCDKNIFYPLPDEYDAGSISPPIIRVLFERGEFNAFNADHVFGVGFMPSGLFSFGGVKILVTAFYALQDTKTPIESGGAVPGD